MWEGKATMTVKTIWFRNTWFRNGLEIQRISLQLEKLNTFFSIALTILLLLWVNREVQI
jgi:hypothetical protein